jgi:hypothetical protein
MAVRGFVKSDRSKKSVMRVGARYMDFTAVLPNGDTVNMLVWADRRVEVKGTRVGSGWKQRTLFEGEV